MTTAPLSRIPLPFRRRAARVLARAAATLSPADVPTRAEIDDLRSGFAALSARQAALSDAISAAYVITGRPVPARLAAESHLKAVAS